MKKILAKFAAVAAVGAACAVPAMGVASAQPPAWPGFNHPGQVNPADPFHNDWHCDRQGNWHNDQHDGIGRRDPRCRAW